MRRGAKRLGSADLRPEDPRNRRGEVRVRVMAPPDFSLCPAAHGKTDARGWRNFQPIGGPNRGCGSQEVDADQLFDARPPRHDAVSSGTVKPDRLLQCFCQGACRLGGRSCGSPHSRTGSQAAPEASGVSLPASLASPAVTGFAPDVFFLH